MIFSIKVILTNYQSKLTELARLSDSLSYRKTLERGYVIVRNIDHLILGSSKEAKNAKSINLEFKDGKVSAEVYRKI